MEVREKPKFAMYWAAACGGCEIAVLNIGERILDVDAAFDIAFWPVAADFKYEDVRNYPDRYIDLCLYNGAVRNSENKEIAHLLRQKSKVLVAFGSCASTGGIPALANLSTRDEIFSAVYLDNFSTPNPTGVIPQPVSQLPEGELYVPEFFEAVKSLDQVVPVDYVIPGCPPEPHQIWGVLEAIVTGAELPPPGGAVVGAGHVALCDECPLEKHEKQIEHFYRPHEIIPEPGLCLLEQGLLCVGPATRSGCGALCPSVGMGCRGCYGPLPGVEDQGARILAAIASVSQAGSLGEDEQQLDDLAEQLMTTLVDPAGTFYRFGLAHSFLNRARTHRNGSLRGGLS
jgi:F420-non-reducing hydrogenase small subunit